MVARAITPGWRAGEDEIQDDMSEHCAVESPPGVAEWREYLRYVDRAKVRGEVVMEFETWINTDFREAKNET